MDTKPARTDRTWLYVGLAFIVFWGVYLTFYSPRGPALNGPGAGQTADYGWQLRDLEGKTHAFAEFKGKPVFLNVWATWCGPCVRELPSIAKLAADPKVSGVAVVCVATDGSPEPVRQFVKDRNWPKSMNVLHATDLPPVFATEGIPATFLIDKDGRIVASEVGAADWSVPSVLEFLQRLQRGEPVEGAQGPHPGPA